jgi:hypothetical protein
MHARLRTAWVAPLSHFEKIGTSFCQLNDDQLEEQILMNKKKMEPMGKKMKNKEEKKKNPDDKDDIN